MSLGGALNVVGWDNPYYAPELRESLRWSVLERVRRAVVAEIEKGGDAQELVELSNLEATMAALQTHKPEPPKQDWRSLL